MSTQTQRERFEAWAATHDLDLTPGVPGQYSDCNTDYAWIAAQHFEAAAVERCAQYLESVSQESSILRHLANKIRALLKTEGSAG